MAQTPPGHATSTGVARALRSLTASDSAVDAARRREAAERLGGSRVESLPSRCAATVCGVLRSVTLRPTENSCSVEAELCDGSDTVHLVWIGRRSIPGIEPGRTVRVSGTLSRSHGRRVVYNPLYELLPVDA